MSATETLAGLNAWTEPFVDNPTFDGNAGLAGLLPSLDSCLMDLVRGLALAKSTGLSDSETEQFVLDALVTPLNEAAQALQQIFVPPTGSTDGSVSAYAQSYGRAWAAAAANPMTAILQMQGATFATSLDKIGTILFGNSTTESGGAVGQVWDRVKSIYRTMLFGSTQAESNLAGLVLYALEEGLPALDAEVVYLQRMKKLVRTLNEQCSSLPPSFTPAIPNFAIANRLCEAEERLRRVAVDLRNARKFNRSEFGQATTAVCDSKDMIFDGSMSSTVQKQIKNFFALNDKQWAALKAGKFLPDVRFRITMIELQTLDAAMLKVDTQVISLHRNLLGLMTTLQSLSSIHAADILAIIVEVLKRQVGALRADLEAQSAGFKGALATVPGAPISQEQTTGPLVTKAGPSRRFTNEGSSATSNDIMSYLSSQATAYAMLSSMCFVMERTQALYKNIDAIVNGNSRFIKMVMDIIGMYKAKGCGSDLGGTLVDEALHAYFDTIEGRLNGTVTSNARIGEAARRVVNRIDDHLKFLACMRDGLFMGRSRLADQAMLVLNAVSAARNIASLCMRIPQVGEIAKTLALEKLTAEGAIEYNAADTVMRALQCMILQCQNEALKGLLREAHNQFGKTFDLNKAQSITMASLGELPRVSQQLALNQRVQAFFRLIASLQRVAALNPRELCAINTKKTPATKEPKNPSAADTSEAQKRRYQAQLGTKNKAAQAAAESDARAAAIAASTPLA